MDLASVVAALASVGVRVSGSAPNSSVQVDSSRACPPGLAGPEPSGTIHDPGQHFRLCSFLCFMCSTGRLTVKCLKIRELWYVAYMLAYASVLSLTICRITWSLWLGTRGLTKLGLKLMS